MNLHCSLRLIYTMICTSFSLRLCSLFLLKFLEFPLIVSLDILIVSLWYSKDFHSKFHSTPRRLVLSIRALSVSNLLTEKFIIIQVRICHRDIVRLSTNLVDSGERKCFNGKQIVFALACSYTLHSYTSCLWW